MNDDLCVNIKKSSTKLDVISTYPGSELNIKYRPNFLKFDRE